MNRHLHHKKIFENIYSINQNTEQCKNSTSHIVSSALMFNTLIQMFQLHWVIVLLCNNVLSKATEKSKSNT